MARQAAVSKHGAFRVDALRARGVMGVVRISISGVVAGSSSSDTSSRS